MVDFDEIFSKAAKDLGCEYILGTLSNVEAKLSDTDISKSNGLIYVLPVKITPVYFNGLVQYNNYSTGVAICRLGNLADGFDTKYRTELKQMTEVLTAFFKLIGGCSGSITITSLNIEYAANRMSSNLDCVISNLTFKDE